MNLDAARRLSRKVARKKHYDLPLQRGSGGRLVMWTVGVMTYLTVLMLVLVFALTALQHYWQSGMTGRMTVEIPYQKNDLLSDTEKEKLVSALNDLPGVTARVLTHRDIADLVGAWLGEDAVLEDLPLPVMVDVTRENSDSAASIDAIRETAQSAVPDSILDTHEEWLADLMRLAKTCRMILIIISVILAFTAALTVAATARTRLALHRDEVDLLHLIGATDDYIATQFQRQAFRLATEGAALGLVAGFTTLGIIALIKRRLGSDLIPQITLSPLEWLFLLLVPFAAGLIAMAASRVTVLQALKQMP